MWRILSPSKSITPPPEIAGRLKLGPTTDVWVVRRHVRYIDGGPAIISDDYFDERIVRGTELAEPQDTTREDILKGIRLAPERGFSERLRAGGAAG